MARKNSDLDDSSTGVIADEIKVKLSRLKAQLKSSKRKKLATVPKSIPKKSTVKKQAEVKKKAKKKAEEEYKAKNKEEVEQQQTKNEQE